VIAIVQEAGWSSGLVCTGAENLAPHQDFYPRPTTLCWPTSQSHHICEINHIWVWLLA